MHTAFFSDTEMNMTVSPIHWVEAGNNFRGERLGGDLKKLLWVAHLGDFMVSSIDEFPRFIPVILWKVNDG